MENTIIVVNYPIRVCSMQYVNHLQCFDWACDQPSQIFFLLLFLGILMLIRTLRGEDRIVLTMWRRVALPSTSIISDWRPCPWPNIYLQILIVVTCYKSQHFMCRLKITAKISIQGSMIYTC